MRYALVFMLLPLSIFGQRIEEKEIYYINSSDVVVLSDTSQPAEVIHRPSKNFGVFVVSSFNKWSFIRYTDGSTYKGYVLNDYLSKSLAEVRADRRPVVREVDDFTGVVSIKPGTSALTPIINDGDLRGVLGLYWQSDLGFYMLLTTSSDSWTFLRSVKRDDATMYVIADGNRLQLTNGVRASDDVRRGNVYEQYMWHPSDETLQTLINANTLRMKLGTVEFPEIPFKLKENWRKIYNTAKKEQS